MNRHNKGDLQQLQSLPLEAKILMTQRRIRDWVDYWHGDVYVSFSGGKDSTAMLLRMIEKRGCSIPVYFTADSLVYANPETCLYQLPKSKSFWTYLFAC